MVVDGFVETVALPVLWNTLPPTFYLVPLLCFHPRKITIKSKSSCKAHITWRWWWVFGCFIHVLLVLVCYQFRSSWSCRGASPVSSLLHLHQRQTTSLTEIYLSLPNLLNQIHWTLQSLNLIPLPLQLRKTPLFLVLPPLLFFTNAF